MCGQTLWNTLPHTKCAHTHKHTSDNNYSLRSCCVPFPSIQREKCLKSWDICHTSDPKEGNRVNEKEFLSCVTSHFLSIHPHTHSHPHTHNKQRMSPQWYCSRLSSETFSPTICEVSRQRYTTEIIHPAFLTGSCTHWEMQCKGRGGSKGGGGAPGPVPPPFASSPLYFPPY